MEIKDPIHGSLEMTPPEVAVLESPAFQRLRSIKQLGFGEFSYPGATHNRYIHALGCCHLAGLAFDSVFRNFHFKKPEVKWRLRQTLRLAALLHDLGHGPLSHTTEEVMPPVQELNIKAYHIKEDRRANHEDYTIKFLTDSPLTQTIRSNFSDIQPIHVACLIDKTLRAPDDFFMNDGLDLRTILSQIVSSELDVDRMDYLLRDSYFCGTNYGQVEVSWLIGNLAWHVEKDCVHLALNRRALYTFDDFLVSRHHMYLMVYFHHKAIIYDELLNLYLTSPECTFRIPADIESYLRYTDPLLYNHLEDSPNAWAKRIAQRRPFRVLFELHSTEANSRPAKMQQLLEKEGFDVILASSEARLSKYHSTTEDDPSRRIFVVDQYDTMAKPEPLERSTQIFQMYEKARRIERLYVAPEAFEKADSLLKASRI